MSMMMTMTIQTTTATAEPAMMPTGLSAGALTLFMLSGSLITAEGADSRHNSHSPADAPEEGGKRKSQALEPTMLPTVSHEETFPLSGWTWGKLGQTEQGILSICVSKVLVDRAGTSIHLKHLIRIKRNAIISSRMLLTSCKSKLEFHSSKLFHFHEKYYFLLIKVVITCMVIMFTKYFKSV